jgi:hypothetical protein
MREDLVSNKGLALLGYPIELTPDDNGTLLVICPDLPEVTTFASDRAEAPLRAGTPSRRLSRTACRTSRTYRRRPRQPAVPSPRC